jgi:competence protein ComEC
VDILWRLGAAPRRIAAPMAAAVGLAAGFYPRPSPAAALLAAAIALAGTGLALRRLTRAIGASAEAAGRGFRAWGLLFLACAIGMAAGVGLALDDEARSLFAASSLFGASSQGATMPAGEPAAAAGSPGRLEPRSLEGELAADSSPVKNGFRSYLVAASRISLVGDLAQGEISFPGGSPASLRVLQRGGPAFDSGVRARFEVRAAKAAASGGSGGAGGALFASSASLLDPGGRLDRARSAARKACRAALSRAGRRSAGLLEALILGSREGLDAEVAEAFKAAGCSHILALSGQHLSVLAILVVAALRPLAGPRRARAFAALAATAFVWLAGPGPSLLRALIMAWLGALAMALDRPQGWLGILALCFIVALPADPGAARSLGFLLSYLAVWGLAALGPRFVHLLSPALPPPLCSAAAASLSAQAATSPLLAAAFGSLQLAGVLASMAAGPLVTALMWWGMGAGALCAMVPAASAVASPVSDLLYDLLVGVMRVAAAVPPIALPGGLARAAAAASVGAAAGIVYALPWIEYRRHGEQAASSGRL